jgi:hypothetical protein
MKTLEEKNGLIAKFMGLKFKDDDKYIKELKEMRSNGIYFEQGYMTSELKYHESWDWLMPVVEKIESFEGTNGNNYKFTIQNETSFVDCTNIISSPSVKSKIQSTYETVVMFIKFYNEQK